MPLGTLFAQFFSWNKFLFLLFLMFRIQHDQLVEFKGRIMEAHASLQKELAKAKHEAREAIEAK